MEPCHYFYTFSVSLHLSMVVVVVVVVVVLVPQHLVAGGPNYTTPSFGADLADKITLAELFVL